MFKLKNKINKENISAILDKWRKNWSVTKHRLVTNVKWDFAHLPDKLKRIPGALLDWAKNKIGFFITMAVLAIFLIAGTVSLNKARANAITFDENYEAPEATTSLGKDGEYVSVAKSDKLELLFCEERGAVKIKNLENGHIWSSIVDKGVTDLSKYSKVQLNGMQSAVSVSYLDMKKRDSKLQELVSAKDCGSLEVEKLDNGISVTYGFLKRGIYVTVEYLLDGDEFVVRVPGDKIVEMTKYGVESVRVLPYFGACDNSNDGYLLYPDGSGAITSFSRTDKRNANSLNAKYYVYSPRDVEILNFTQDNMDRYTASLPLFGIKNGDNAFMVYGTTGVENTAISVSPYGQGNIYVNHANFEIYARNSFNVYSGITGSTSGTAGKVLKRYDKLPMGADCEFRYVFLSGDKANYAGMAEEYREYLIENGLLNDSITDGDVYPLALRMLMGTTKAGVIFDEYVSMTTFGQVREMIEELNDMNVLSRKIVLEDWCKKSEDYNYWAPDSKLGGKSGLKNLGSYAANDNSTQIFIEQSTTFGTSDTKGLREVQEVAYNGLNLNVSATLAKGGSIYLLNPLIIAKRNESLLSKIENYSGVNVAYADIGVYAYADYNEDHPYTKAETVEQFRNVLSAAQSAEKDVAVGGSNQYVLSYADYLYDLSEKSYGLAITDYSVPFVQMVVSGRIPYSTRGAGNLAYDLDIQKLKWIEFGSVPYFYVTYESALNLRDTDNNTLFSSTWDDWKKIIADTYNEFSTNFSCIYGKQMTGHNIITDDLISVEYENGVKIYLNYGENEARIDGLTVPAKGYKVTGGYSK